MPSARLPFPTAAASSSPPTPVTFDSIASLMESLDALEVLLALRKTGLLLKKMIQDEMRSREGWAWDVHVGFHASESMK